MQDIAVLYGLTRCSGRKEKNMKKALMLRGLLAAATLSLGSVALAGTAGATNLTVGMYVGTNADNVSC